MTLLPLPLGPKLKKYNYLVLGLVSTLSLVGFISLFPISAGDRYFRKLSHYYRLINAQEFNKADRLQSKLDQHDIRYMAGLSHPRYIADTIKNILKKTNRNTDDLIEVSLLYFKIGDTQNSRHFLLLAQQSDPVRSDINKLFQQLF